MSPEAAPSRADAAAGFDRVRTFIETLTGVTIAAHRAEFVVSRTRHLTELAGVGTLSALVDRATCDAALADALVDAVVTTETLWFREPHALDALRDTLLTERSAASAGRVRIWSAACATGQEPYSIAMAVAEREARAAGNPQTSVEILASDLSSGALRRAHEARYSERDIRRGLSVERRDRFFEAEGAEWLVTPDIRGRVQFRRQDLRDDFSNCGTFDVVFLRNVLIYLSEPVRADIVRRVATVLRPGGYLVVGRSDFVWKWADALRLLKDSDSTIYRRVR